MKTTAPLSLPKKSASLSWAAADAVRHPPHEGNLDVLRLEPAHLDDVLAGTEVPDQIDAVAFRVIVGVLAVIAIEIVADDEFGQLAVVRSRKIFPLSIPP